MEGLSQGMLFRRREGGPQKQRGSPQPLVPGEHPMGRGGQEHAQDKRQA